MLFDQFRIGGGKAAGHHLCRSKMKTVEVSQFSADYHDPEKRSSANSLHVVLADRTTLEETVEYPIGHKGRREEGMPLLVAKFKTNLARRFPLEQQTKILDVSLDQAALENIPVQEYVDLYVILEHNQIRRGLAEICYMHLVTITAALSVDLLFQSSCLFL